ncbi:MAG: ABC transporter permease [Thermofilum sp.]|nr:ABC transporter permease [Thermofilum sp.]MCC6059777.1 ABC transporter permease [Thermofilum sp.]
MSRRARLGLLCTLRGVMAKELKLAFRYVGSLVTIAAMPFMVSGLFLGIGYAVAGPAAFRNFEANTGASSPLLYMTLGGVLMIASMVIVENTSTVIREEQLMGTFELHYLTPNSAVLLWLLHALAHSTLMILLFTLDVVAVVAWQGGLLTPYEWGVAAAVILLAMLPLAGIGLVIAALTVRFKEVWAAANLVNSFIAALSGFYYPLEIFPRVVQLAAGALPTTHAAEVLKSVVARVPVELPLWQRVAIMACLALAYLAVGKLFYSRWEDEARRRGELSKY